MSKMKELVMDVLDSLEKSGMDYEKTADMYGMSPAEVYQIAKDYGDIDDSDYV